MPDRVWFGSVHKLFRSFVWLISVFSGTVGTVRTDAEVFLSIFISDVNAFKLKTARSFCNSRKHFLFFLTKLQKSVSIVTEHVVSNYLEVTEESYLFIQALKKHWTAWTFALKYIFFCFCFLCVCQSKYFYTCNNVHSHVINICQTQRTLSCFK